MSAPVHATKLGGDCTASVVSQVLIGMTRVLWTGTHADLSYGRVGSKLMVTKVTYNMGSPWFQYILPPGPPLPWLVNMGTHNNVNVTAPVARSSPDNLGTSGVYDFADFAAKPNSLVKVQMIPDFKDNPDPKCTMSFTVA